MRAGIALILLVALAGCGTTRSVTVSSTGYYSRAPVGYYSKPPVVVVHPGYRGKGWRRGWYR